MIDSLGSPQSLAVIGGTSDIGLAVAERMVRDRVRRVVLAGRDPVGLQAAAGRLRDAGALDVDAVAFDAADTAGHGEAVASMFAGGDLDVVLVAFGVLGDQAAAEADPDLAVRVAQVNYVGAVSVGLRVASSLQAQGHGHLVFLSSAAADRGRRSNYVYGSSKAGLDTFAQGMGDALAGTGVRVTVVRPGFVRTRMTAGLDEAPLACDPGDVAEAVVEAVRRGRETVYVPATLRVVMSGLKHLPRPMFRRLDL